jgi:hypothetical protein
MDDESFLDFGEWKIRKCCSWLASSIMNHYMYSMENGKLIIGEYDDDMMYEEYEMKYCMGCGKPLEYYK